MWEGNRFGGIEEACGRPRFQFIRHSRRVLREMRMLSFFYVVAALEALMFSYPAGALSRFVRH